MSRAGTHDGLDRRHQTARRAPDDDVAAARAFVDVGLAVRNDNDLVAAQLGAEQRAQPVRIPRRVRTERSAVLVLEVAQPEAQVRGKRRELARRCDRPDQALAAQQRARPGNPAAPAELGDDDGDEGDHGAERGDQNDKVLLGVLAALGDEAEILQHHQICDRPGLAHNLVNADVNRTACDANHR